MFPVALAATAADVVDVGLVGGGVVALLLRFKVLLVRDIDLGLTGGNVEAAE